MATDRKKTAKQPPRKKKEANKAGNGTGKSVMDQKIVPIVLESRLGIQNVSALKTRLSSHCQQGMPAIIDASAVETVDTAALQLLVAFVNSLCSQAQTVEWRTPSSAFTEMAVLADLSGPLDLPINCNDRNSGHQGAAI